MICDDCWTIQHALSVPETNERIKLTVGSTSRIFTNSKAGWRMYWESQGQDWSFDCNPKGCLFCCVNLCKCGIFKCCAGNGTEGEIKYNRDGTLKGVAIIRDSDMSDGVGVRNQQTANLRPVGHVGIRNERRNLRLTQKTKDALAAERK